MLACFHTQTLKRLACAFCTLFLSTANWISLFTKIQVWMLHGALYFIFMYLYVNMHVKNCLLLITNMFCMHDLYIVHMYMYVHGKRCTCVCCLKMFSPWKFCAWQFYILIYMYIYVQCTSTWSVYNYICTVHLQTYQGLLKSSVW